MTVARDYFAAAVVPGAKTYTMDGEYSEVEGVPYAQQLVHQVDVFPVGGTGKG